MTYARSHSQSPARHWRGVVRLGTLLLAPALLAVPLQARAQTHLEDYGRSSVSVTGKGWSGGLRAGTLLGQVEKASEMGPQFGGFLRHSILPQLTGEVAGSYGRLRGNWYSTDMTLGEVKVLYMPTAERYIPRTQLQMKPYVYAGLGGMRFNLDEIPADRSVGTPSIGWAATAPVGLGLELPLLANVGLDLNVGYTYTLDDDLDAIRSGSKKDAYWNMSVGIVFRDVRGARRSAPQPTASMTAHSAEQMRQSQAIQARYDALRDSLTAALPASSAEALRTMREMVRFNNDRSDLSDEARSLLRDKVVIFEANPKMRIVITGYSSTPGAPGYNMALGLRRAEAARAYLLSRGVDQERIEIATHGEGRLLVEGTGTRADVANRRVEFRLLVADPYLAAPAN